ncbi:hypothetical protein VTO42DRAFT_4555 [Malbranchea cinnamomea]
MEENPVPDAIAPIQPNNAAIIAAINRHKDRGRLYWINTDHPLCWFRLPCEDHDALGASLENRNTVIGTLYMGGFFIMNISEHPDAVTRAVTDTTYGHMVCKLAMYMQEWQQHRQQHPESWSFIIRPYNGDRQVLDHRGYVDRTFKQLNMRFVEVRYQDGGPRQYVCLMFKGRHAPMAVFSSGYYLSTDTNGLRPGAPYPFPE